MIWLLFALIIIIFIVITYNQFIFLDNITKNAWVGIDINIKLRNDLIPSIIDIVKNYSKYEKSTFKELAELRVTMDSSKSISKKGVLNNKISSSMKNFFLVAESYPKLMANNSFLKLQNELSRLESNIAFKRQFYNDTVFKHNTFLMSFPSNIVGKIFGFKAKESFVDDSEYKEVKL